MDGLDGQADFLAHLAHERIEQSFARFNAAARNLVQAGEELLVWRAPQDQHTAIPFDDRAYDELLDSVTFSHIEKVRDFRRITGHKGTPQQNQDRRVGL